MKTSLARNIPWNIYNSLKIFVNLLLVLLSAIDLGFAVSRKNNGEEIYDVDIVTPIIKLITFVSLILIKLNINYL